MLASGRMEESGSFRMHPAQKRFFEDGPRRIYRGGREVGRRYATELWIRGTASSPEQAELAIADLHSRGIAMLDDKGNRVAPGGRRRFTIVRFDEEPR